MQVIATYSHHFFRLISGNIVTKSMNAEHSRVVHTFEVVCISITNTISIEMEATTLANFPRTLSVSRKG
eukprot:5979052-Pleurochrysis_carterae.AAC.2